MGLTAGDIPGGVVSTSIAMPSMVAMVGGVIYGCPWYGLMMVAVLIVGSFPRCRVPSNHMVLMILLITSMILITHELAMFLYNYSGCGCL